MFSVAIHHWCVLLAGSVHVYSIARHLMSMGHSSRVGFVTASFLFLQSWRECMYFHSFC